MSDNGTATKQNETVEELSVQARAEPQSLGANVGSFFFHRAAGLEDEIAPWWSPSRDIDLRDFWKEVGNDILQGAISSMVKKIKATGWTLEGGERVVNNFQAVLSEAEFGMGWGQLLGKTLLDYSTQDKGAFWELIGDGDPTGPIKGPVLGVAHLDSGLCQLTGDPTYPVLFWNTKRDKKEAHKLHTTRVAHIVDMPSPMESMLGVGFCAISRVISSSQVLLKLQQYKNEKLSDLPPAGLLLLNNILPRQWDDARQDYKQGRRRLGQELWASVMTLFGLDPAQPTTAEFLSFADLPEHFDELTSINVYVNILALAFGVDVREFWPLSGGSLGTATESQVMHQKAKGKGPGEIYATLERVINWKILPPTVTFKFDYKDDEEDQLRASIEDAKTKTIMSMWNVKTPGGGEIKDEPPVSRLEIRQMLADNVSYFSEEFLTVDVTEEVEVTDTEREKMIGKPVKVNHKGIIQKPRKKQENFNEVLRMAEENYKAGRIDFETLMEFRLGQVIDEHQRI